MKKKTIWITLAVVVAIMAGLHLYYSDRGRFTTEPVNTGLARTVSANELTSPGDPAVVMQFSPEYRHLGGQQFILYGVADTEQHFFIETTPDDRLKSLYWLQFEAYLPDNSYSYDYDDSPLRLSIGEYEFFVDTAPVRSDPTRRRRGTDGGLARQFLSSKGYELPQDYAYARMVHLTDESRRKELMIIFIVDLAPLGVTGTALQQGGADEQRWPEIEQSHLDRVRESITLIRP